MTFSAASPRLLLAGLISLGLVLPARAASDPRKILCAKATTLVLKAGNGSIDVKIPTASGTLRTLYKEGDSIELEGGKDYVLVFNESKDGRFSFDLQFAPTGGGPVWSCRVKTIPTAPFIDIQPGPWSGAPDQVTINTDRTQAFITIHAS
jgi:hypothetical protein